MRFSKRECVLLTVLAVLLIWSVGRSRILEPAMERRMSAREECSRLERERIEAEQFIDVVIVSEPTLEESGDRFFYETMEDVLPSILRKVRFGTLDELYASIGYGGTTAVKSVARIKDELLRLGRLKAEKAAASSRTTAESVIVPGTAAPVDVSQLKGSNKHTDSGIIVEGLGNCLVKFAKCCTPVPGDPVIGFITRGYGVSVHRADCPNAAPENRKPEEAARWVRVSWVDSKLPNYRTALEVASKDRDNLTLDVAMALSAAKVKVTALSARSMPDGHAILRIEVEVRDKEELASVINKLNNIQGVYHVARMTGK